MIFLITRTSDWDTKPCDEAFEMDYTRIDERIIDDPFIISCDPQRDWYGVGRNHRVENGHLKRDITSKRWFVEFIDFGGLVAFTRKYGECIISPGEPPSIEIYDDYRE